MTVSNPEVAAARLVNGVVQVVGLTEGTTMVVVSSADGQAIPDACQVTVYTEVGDVNCDGYVDISDVTTLIDFLLSPNISQINMNNADTDQSGTVNIADVTDLIDYLLNGFWPVDDSIEWVDLGIGTLWAARNVGADKPWDYGDYFAWGETEPKDYYDWSTYKWCNGSYDTLTKYCIGVYDETSDSIISYGGYNNFYDNKMELDPEDDAAYVNWGPEWRIPTIEEIEDLGQRCTWEWTTRYGVKGQLVTGPNGNSIFLPAAGVRVGDSLELNGSDGCYMSKYSNYAVFPGGFMILNFNMYAWDTLSLGNRASGYPVRAVRVS